MNRMLALRISIVASALLGTTYVTWRWLFSLNMSAWWIAVPLVICETYSIIDSLNCSMFRYPSGSHRSGGILFTIYPVHDCQPTDFSLRQPWHFNVERAAIQLCLIPSVDKSNYFLNCECLLQKTHELRGYSKNSK